LCDLIAQRGFAVHRLPVSDAAIEMEPVPVHAAWLGATWQKDAEQTRSAIRADGAPPDWIVVDHYAIEQRWERALRESTVHTMVIDDLADREHDCEELLDQNLFARMQQRYAGKVPAGCEPMLGPDYALLQPQYAVLHDSTSARAGPIRRILIYFGGADSDNLTGRALAGVLRLNRPEIAVDVVLAAGSPHAAAVRKLAQGRDDIVFHSLLPTLAPLMVRADLAIGASGATSWERFCLGLPALVVSLAENQRPLAAHLHELGLVQWLGHKEQVDAQAIAEALSGVLHANSLAQWSSRCAQVCDGRGVSRVAQRMTAGV
jgi:UDP-2,4-diacetamido-2,4,6-trideoxy-beta-L-altropyranose hydrolase